MLWVSTLVSMAVKSLPSEDLLAGVASDREPRASGGAVGGEGGDDRVAAWHEGSVQSVRVGSPVSGINKKVQDGSVVPDAVATRRLPGEQVRSHPLNSVAVLSQATARQAQRDLGNVEHGQIGVSGGQ